MKRFMILILAIVLVLSLGFVLVKFGYLDLSSIGLGPKFIGGPDYYSDLKVIVVGRASHEMDALLKSEDFALAGITYAGDLPQQSVTSAGVFKNFDVIIVQGSRICNETARTAIAEAVNGGKKMVLIGDACTATPDDPNEGSWGELGEVMPVMISSVLFEADDEAVYALKIDEPDHPIFNGVFDHEINAPEQTVLQKQDATVLAHTDYAQRNAEVYPQATIVESSDNRVIYFAFDPAPNVQTAMGSRNLFLSTLLYLKGRLKPEETL
ncbi:MAG: hypothetical protein V1834_02315 [Candidatus Micrarchaeota archaeon]